MGDDSLLPEFEYIGHFGSGPGGGSVAAYSPKNDVVIVIVTNFSDPVYPVAGLMFNLLSQIDNP
jgi:CubicO group peptidase (beta-lactamase class C family)